MAAPGWPKQETIPEAAVVRIDADSSVHGSRDGSHHGSRHGSVRGSLYGSHHGSQAYAQAVETTSDPQLFPAVPAPLQRRGSRKSLGLSANDHAQDYAGAYPHEQDKEPSLESVAKQHNFHPWAILRAYFRKWRGGLDEALPIPAVPDLITSFVGSFLGMLWIAGLSHALDLRVRQNILGATFGASAVLLYGVMESKLAQPRNVLVGQVMSAAIGAAFRLAFRQNTWVAAPFALSFSLLAMQLTRTVHPPGGATAILASQANPIPAGAGFSFMLVVLVGALGQLLIALIINNLNTKKRYPTYWFGGKL